MPTVPLNSPDIIQHVTTVIRRIFLLILRFYPKFVKLPVLMAMAALPPRRNPTPTKISKQNMTPLQILLQMGFPKHRAEKALAATGHRGVQLASDWLLAHVNDPLLDDNSPREYILYACPTGGFLQQLQNYWEKSRTDCAWNGAHNFIPHITLVSFFKAPDEDSFNLAQSLKAVMERQGAILNEPLKLETYTSPNFLGFFVSEEHADYLKRIAMQFVKEVSNATISLEPHVKSLHLTLAYQFPGNHYSRLKSLVDELDASCSSSWELRLYSRDPRVNNKQVNKVIHPYQPSEADELDLRTGDYIYISTEAVSNSPDGWVEGTSWLTGLTGLLPESYTERTAESDAWTLHRKIPLNNIMQENSTMSETKRESNGEAVGIKANDDAAEIPKFAPEEHHYENMLKMRATGSLYEASESRKLFLMRHGERVDFTFGTWIPYCFDENGTYIRKDLNMPESIPNRSQGPQGYYKDTPLTKVGTFQAETIGEGLKSKNIDISYAYASPSFRSIQTCDAFLRGCSKKDSVKIKIEPGLFEWTYWYQSNLPDFLTIEELIEAGFNIDTDYEPFIKLEDLRDVQESCEEFYARNRFVAEGALSSHPSGNIILVGHAATLDVCSRELIGKKPRLGNEMTKLIQKIPYCGLIQLAQDGEKWEIVEPPFPPITHTTNQRFDYKILFN